IVSFARTLAHSGENRKTAVAFGNVIDQFHDHHRLAHPGAAKRSDFAAFRKGTNQIDHLDAGLEDLRCRILLSETGRFAMKWIAFRKSDRSTIIDRIAGHVKNAAQRPLAYRHRDRTARIGYGHSALKAFS